MGRESLPWLLKPPTKNTISTWKFWSTSRRSWRKTTWQKWKQFGWGSIAIAPGEDLLPKAELRASCKTSWQKGCQRGCLAKAACKNVQHVPLGKRCCTGFWRIAQTSCQKGCVWQLGLTSVCVCVPKWCTPGSMGRVGRCVNPSMFFVWWFFGNVVLRGLLLLRGVFCVNWAKKPHVNSMGKGVHVLMCHAQAWNQVFLAQRGLWLCLLSWTSCQKGSPSPAFHPLTKGIHSPNSKPRGIFSF